MRLTALNRRIDSVVFTLCRVPNLFGIYLILIIMFSTILDIALRYSINKSLLGLYEIIQLIMVIIVSLSFGYTQTEKSHVNIVFLTDRMPLGIRRCIDCFNLLASTAFFGFMVIAGIMQVKNEYVKEGMTPILEIPTYPFYAIFVIGSLIMLLVFIRDLLAFTGDE